MSASSTSTSGRTQGELSFPYVSVTRTGCEVPGTKGCNRSGRVIVEKNIAQNVTLEYNTRRDIEVMRFTFIKHPLSN